MGRMGRWVVVIGLLLGATAIALAAAGRQPAVNVSKNGLAMNGYDAVAYVTDGRPVEGSPQFETKWNGVLWRFASAAHRDAFFENPERYAPQFGGYCAYAVSQGHTANGDPRVWKIVDGRLYLNYYTSVQRTWEKGIPGYIAKGRGNWPAVLDK
jgi:YHS domain-containing protein